MGNKHLVLPFLLVITTGFSAAAPVVDVPVFGPVEIPLVGGPDDTEVELGPGTGIEDRGTGQASEPPGLALGLKNDSTFIDESTPSAVDAPNRSHVVGADVSGNYESYYIGQCYGEGSNRANGPSGNVKKSERVFANSYAENTSTGARWIDPDASADALERGNMSCDLTGNDWGIARSGRLLEEGGTISGIRFTESNSMVMPSGSTLCIGENCEIARGSPTSEDTDDVHVDETGDEMSGTLRTDKLRNSDRLCVGANCGDGSYSHDQSESLHFQNKEMTGTPDTGARLKTPDIAPRGSTMCLGTNCEPVS